MQFRFCSANHSNVQAFTLIELLVVVAIIGVLAGILVPVAGACRKHAYKTKETVAARQLMVAYLMAADENHGILMSAKDLDQANFARNETGNTMFTVAGERWPHRLRPYLANRFKNTLYVNDQAAYYERITTNADSMTDYRLSLGPSFGINGGFVGAVSYTDARKRKNNDVPVRTLALAEVPAQLIAFTSAQDRASLGEGAGYFSVESPDTWPAGDISEPPAAPSRDQDYGFVSFRHGGKAVVAFLDGHVELRPCARLRDMRLWSNEARRTNNPNYVPSSL